MTQAEIEEQIDVQITLGKMMPAKAILAINAISILRDMSKALPSAKKLIESV
jgi:hypothetical protein